MKALSIANGFKWGTNDVHLHERRQHIFRFADNGLKLGAKASGMERMELNSRS